MDALTFLAATTTHAAFWKKKKNYFDERCNAEEVDHHKNLGEQSDCTAEGQLTAARQVTLGAPCKICPLPISLYSNHKLLITSFYRTKYFQQALKSKPRKHRDTENATCSTTKTLSNFSIIMFNNCCCFCLRELQHIYCTDKTARATRGEVCLELLPLCHSS